MYSNKFNLLFIHIPKTAGQSIAKHFMQIEAIAWENRKQYLMFRNGDPDHGSPQVAHFTLKEYYNTDLIPDDVIDNAIKFTVVRNPWDRLWSEYNFYWKDICSWDGFFGFFPKYIFDDYKTGRDALRHIKPQFEFIDDTVEILRFENLDQDFEQFCARHNLPCRGLQKDFNASNAGSYQGVYDADKIEAVAEYYFQDIAHFGYEFTP